jgi:hypothetical protein
MVGLALSLSWHFHFLGTFTLSYSIGKMPNNIQWVSHAIAACFLNIL